MNAIAFVIAAVILGVPISIGVARMSRGEIVNPEVQYITTVAEAVFVYSQDIPIKLQRLVLTKTLTVEEMEELNRIIDEQIAADRKILGYDMEKLENYAELHMGVRNLCNDEVEILQQIKSSINRGMVPSYELWQNYVSLRGENYLWVLEEFAKIFTEMSVENISGG